MRLLFGIPLLALPLFCFAQAGHLDPSFGSGGIVQTSFGSGNTFAVSGAALFPNGNIIVSGTITVTSTPAVSSAVVRYLPSGALGSTFGKGGILNLPAPAALPGSESLAFGVAVQLNEQILVISDAFNTSGVSRRGAAASQRKRSA